MEASKNVTIIRRAVKHARLRVREDQSVELITPNDFTVQDIARILERKAGWIESHQRFFREHSPGSKVAAIDTVQLFGEEYHFELVPELKRDVVVDSTMKLVRSGRSFDGGQQTRWQREFARRFLVERTATLARRHKLVYGRVFVRSQKTRWGNCSVKGNISLNWHLLEAPEYVIDYVILHELVHTRVMNHSQRFWVQLSAICPEIKKAVRWLNSNRPL